MEGANFDSLNEDCLVHILSLTSPGDVCRLRAVSPLLRSAAESDTIWEKFLPPDWEDMLPRTPSSPQYSSMKELFFLLTQPQLIDDGRRSLWLDKATGKKCLVLPAKELSIQWREDRRRWQVIASSDHRYCYDGLHLWINACGRISMSCLSPNTMYSVRFVVRYSPSSVGRRHSSMKLSLKVDKEPPVRKMTKIIPPNLAESVLLPFTEDDDDWVQVWVGEFYCDGGEGDIEFGMKEVDEFREGILILGAEIRPMSYGREVSGSNQQRPIYI